MTPNRYLMGIDGGGSKTLALLADETGRVLGRGEAGASNFQVIGHQAAQAAIQAAVDAAWRNAGLGAKLPSKLGGWRASGHLPCPQSVTIAIFVLDKERLF